MLLTTITDSATLKDFAQAKFSMNIPPSQKIHSAGGHLHSTNSPVTSKSSNNYTFPPRTTAANGIVAAIPIVAKPSSRCPTNVPSRGSNRTTMQADDDFEPVNHIVGGLHDEDDSQERVAALSSPLKGSEQRAETKVRYFLAI